MNEKNENLIICVSSNGENLDIEIDPRFGRCKNFLIIEVNGKDILNTKVVKNIGAEQGSGAGISAAEQIGKIGVNLLITGDVGPKATDVLKQLEIEVCKKSGIAREAVNECMNGMQNTNKEEDEALNNEIKIDSKIDKNDIIFIPLMEDNGENSIISLHFGHAPFFGSYDVGLGKFLIVKNELDHSSPDKTPVDQIVEQVNPTIVYAQDMGARAIGLFTERNILLKTGPYRIAKEVIDNIDKLENLTKGCSH